MDIDQFIDKINNTDVQQYLKHRNNTDVVLAAARATEVADRIEVSGTWINTAGLDVYPINYDVINIKKDDLANWTFITRVVGNLTNNG